MTLYSSIGVIKIVLDIPEGQDHIDRTGEFWEELVKEIREYHLLLHTEENVELVSVLQSEYPANRQTTSN